MKNTLIIVVGVLLGVWFFVSKGTLLVLLATGLVLFAAISCIQGKGRRSTMLALCLAALLLRIVFSAVNYYSFLFTGRGVDCIPDARAYSASGQYIAEALTGSTITANDNNDLEWLEHLRFTHKGGIPPIGYRVDEYARYIGVIYAFFGYDPLTIKFINSVLSVFTALLIFFLTRKFFSFRTAVVAFSIYAFMPSIFLWSVTGMRDSLVFFLTMLVVYIYIVYLMEKLNVQELILLMVLAASPNLWIALFAVFGLVLLKYLELRSCMRARYKDMVYFLLPLLLFKVSLLAIAAIKFYIFAILLIAFSLSFITFLKKRTIVIGITAIILLMLLYPFYKNETINAKKIFERLARQAISQHYNKSSVAGSGYETYPEEFYEDARLSLSLPEFMICYVRGMCFAFLTPFPFYASGNTFNIYASIQMLFIYLLIPFILTGILISMKYKWRQTVTILFFVFSMASIFAVCEGNVGTVFRHRDVLTAFAAIFGAIGICNLFGQLYEPKHVKESV